MGNQANNPQSSHGNDPKHSTERQRDDDVSKRGGGKDQAGKDQKQRNDQSGNRSGNDRNRQG